MMQAGLKYEAVVTHVNDPENLGRIRARIIGAEDKYAQTSWMYPDVPFAGPGYGFCFLPALGNLVHIERTAKGDWIWTGFCWTDSKPLPTTASATVRVLRTPVGHQISFDEEGDVHIEASNGARITLKSGGNIEVYADGEVHLNGSGGKVVTTQCLCSYTGGPHPQGSLTVKAKGIVT